jgi:hypothetical protein
MRHVIHKIVEVAITAISSQSTPAKARKTQFEPLQNSVEFHMKYAMIQFDLCNYGRVKACF